MQSTGWFAVLGIAEERVAFAGEAVVELDDRAPEPGRSSAQLQQRLLDLVLRAQVLEALGQGRTPASRNTLRLPDLVPRCRRFGSTPLSGMPRSTASFRSSGVELKTVR